MPDLKQIEEFVLVIEKDIFSSSLPSIKNYKLQKISVQYQELYDLTISLSIELPYIKFTPKNNYTNFNFKDDIGKILYAILNKNDKLLLDVLYKQHYIIQKWWAIILNKYLLKKFREDVLLKQVDVYYKISDLLPYVNLPDILETSNVFSIQSIKRKIIENIVFPFYLFKIPKHTAYKQINYLIKKNDGSVISNITSGKIRQELLLKLTDTSFGVIGVKLKQKNYRRKYNFMLCFYGSDYNNVLSIYKGKENTDIDLTELNNLSYKSDLLIKPKPILIKNKEDLINLLKKAKHNKRYLVLSSQGVDVLKISIKYDYAKIIDYIYNEDYEAIGLKVSYKNKTYDIYFNVMETNYVEGIESKYVKIGISEYAGVVLNIFYNAEVKQWSKKYNSCVICGEVRSKHYKNGVCNSCNYKIEKFCNNLSGSHKEKCSAKFDTLYYEDYEVFGDGEFIYFNLLKGRQMKLPLYEDSNFCL